MTQAKFDTESKSINEYSVKKDPDTNNNLIEDAPSENKLNRTVKNELQKPQLEDEQLQKIRQPDADAIKMYEFLII